MEKLFIFLEILDPDVNSFISNIKEILTGVKPTRPVHLTVRGPYYGKFPKGIIKSCEQKMKNDVIRIAEIGRFSIPNEEVVYFRVDSPHLRDVWWKQDYTIEKYGFEPHVSIFRGQDVKYADDIAAFLQKERIELLCAEYQFNTHCPQQMNLFHHKVLKKSSIDRLLLSGRVKEGFLDRLKDFVIDYQTNSYQQHQDSLTIR